MSSQSNGNTALIIAHPGHELVVWHWLESVRPRVLVVTDGSGQSGTPRIGSSHKLVTAHGAQAGAIFGEFTDRTVYQQTLSGNADFFEYLANRIAIDLIENQIETVVGDAAEGIIMAHDLLREVRRAAIRIAETRLSWRIKHLEFPLDRHPAIKPPSALDEAIELQLTPEELGRKLNVARNYVEISAFVEQAIGAFGEEAFQREFLFESMDKDFLPAPGVSLHYERHGQQLVLDSQYEQAILFSQHVHPIISSLGKICPTSEFPERLKCHPSVS